MRKTLEILFTTLKLAIQELGKNKMRTFLSLFGVTIGIFCIIGVLSTVSSLERNIQDGVKSLGSNTIYIDKWDYSGVETDTLSLLRNLPSCMQSRLVISSHRRRQSS